MILYAQQSFQHVTRAPHWAGGIFDGKVRIPVGELVRVTPRFERVLTHEITHALVHEKTGLNCPRWLNEGLAEYYEGARLARRWPAVGGGDLTSLAEADSLQNNPGLYYVRSLARVEFLMERYSSLRVMRLLSALAQSPDFDAALESSMYLDRSRFETEWVRWLQRESRRLSR